VLALSECTGEAHLGNACVSPASDLPNGRHTHSVPTAHLLVRRNAPQVVVRPNLHVRSVEAFRNKRLARTRMPPPTITPGPSKPCMGQGQTGHMSDTTHIHAWVDVRVPKSCLLPSSTFLLPLPTILHILTSPRPRSRLPPPYHHSTDC